MNYEVYEKTVVGKEIEMRGDVLKYIEQNNIKDVTIFDPMIIDKYTDVPTTLKRELKRLH